MESEFGSLRAKLQKAYQSGATQQELAHLEADYWALKKQRWKEEGRTNIPQKYVHLNAEFGAQQAASGCRSNLLALGAFASFYWEKVDNERLALSVAYRLAREARTVAKNKGLEPWEACKRVWETYTKDAYVARTRTGKLVYRHKSAPSYDSIPEYDPEAWDPNVSDSKSFRAALQMLIDKFVNSRLEGVEEHVREELARTFAYEVRVSYEDLLRKIQRERKALRDDPLRAISFREVRRACEVLSAPAPKKAGELVNMTHARARYRKLAAQFHPDRNGGSEKVVSQFHAINEAWQTIQDYNEQHED